MIHFTTKDPDDDGDFDRAINKPTEELDGTSFAALVLTGIADLDRRFISRKPWSQNSHVAMTALIGAAANLSDQTRTDTAKAKGTARETFLRMAGRTWDMIDTLRGGVDLPEYVPIKEG